MLVFSLLLAPSDLHALPRTSPTVPSILFSCLPLQTIGEILRHLFFEMLCQVAINIWWVALIRVYTLYIPRYATNGKADR